MSRGGLLITFEGLEGAGKSTQAERLCEHLKTEGYPVSLVREPGGSPVGEAIRTLLADPSYKDMTPLTELLLFSASRSQLVEQFIRPQLGEGTIVICDRFIDATLAYQGFGRGVHHTQIREVTDMCTWGVRPDVTFLLDLEPAKGLGRVRTRSVQTLTSMDRLEQLDLAFYEKVREGYLTIADEEPGRFRVLNGDLEPDLLHRQIISLTMKHVKAKIPPRGKLTFERGVLNE